MGFFDATSVSRRKTAHIPVRRPAGYSQRLRRCGRGPGGARQQLKPKPSNCTPPRPSPALCAREGVERSNCTSKDNSNSKIKDSNKIKRKQKLDCRVPRSLL